MITSGQKPKNFNLERYSQIAPTANDWASNLNDRWELIYYLNQGRASEVIYGLNHFYEQAANYEPSISEEEEVSYADYDFPDWSRAASSRCPIF